ncbi:hydantoinase/oxoprolinase family protein [Acerihabitans arboris]|uniref:Hydantoinase/oxoprolinase family protein n=1 Tax=Acerihabitans arboris TaxID=2691583 RepID=A0A845SHJ8_9GAMM|nr:hydantoinase/oxoprolinase family protein [Acerihabitans arboris]NDL62148.1 hydantoinase/oxoprolinase family protein [Acerihabitans arboris]
MIRVGVDIGGTFTDFVVWRSGGQPAPLYCFKVPSTPPHFADGFQQGFERMLAELAVAPDEPVVVMHGTTVSTNAVIERSQPPVALFVTQGFRDILELQRLRLLDPTNLRGCRGLPLIERHQVFEIRQRTAADGGIIEALSADSVARAVAQVRDAGIGSIAVAFINSYQDPQHEQRARELIKALDAGLDVCLSSEVWPRPGEYERAVNALLNVYVKPRMSSYLQQIERYLASRLRHVQLFITRSNGGAMSAREARHFPVHTLLSGPASGVTAAQLITRAAPERHYLTMDMGGTSTDISLIRAGTPSVVEQTEIGDFPLTMPVTGIEAIGAGGGSIGRFDGPVFRVGPKSAGAWPGPACFARGGTQPTVTDAYLLCGYLDAATFLGGDMVLDPAAARAAFAPLAGRMEKTTAGAASAAITIATSNMVASVLPYLARHGVDPQDVMLVAFGGNGAIHGPLLAAEIGIPQVIIPNNPSVFCAVGGVVAELTHDTVAIVQQGAMDTDRLQRTFASLEAQARAWLARQTDPANVIAIVVEYWADIRYRGQSFQIPVRIEAPAPDLITTGMAIDAFHTEHLRLHTHADSQAAVEFIELRARVRGALAAPGGNASARLDGRGAPRPCGYRRLRIGAVSFDDCPVYDRAGLGADARVAGPCIISQSDATLLVPPSFTARVHAGGEIILTQEH